MQSTGSAALPMPSEVLSDSQITVRHPSRTGLIDTQRIRDIPVVARLGEFFQRYAAVKGGLGISLLPCFLGDADATLERLGDVPRELDEDAFLLFHPDMSDLPAVRAVADGITELFATPQAVALRRGSDRPAAGIGENLPAEKIALGSGKIRE